MARVPSGLLAPRSVRYGLAVAWAAIVALGSVAPPPTTGPTLLGPLGLVGLDKWLHALAYAILAGLVAYALLPRSIAGDARVLALAGGIGAALEVVQWPLPARTGDPLDALANLAGATLAVAAWIAGRRLLATRRPWSASTSDSSGDPSAGEAASSSGDGPGVEPDD